MTNIKLVFKYALKDLTKQKARTILGVIGVLISVMLLSIVLFLSDSISGSFVNYLSAGAGNQDMVITVRHYNGEPEDRSSYFEYRPVIEKLKINFSDQIKDYIPRMEVSGKVNISEDFDSNKLTNYQTSVLISGIDFALEDRIGFGEFKEPESEQTLNINSLLPMHCAIYYGLSNIIKNNKGDSITIEMQLTHRDRVIKKKVTVIIDEIIDFKLKWSESYRNSNLLVVDIETLYTIFGENEFEGRCSKLILTFLEGNNLYDVRDTKGSETRVKDIASRMQLDLGIKEYNIALPKLNYLGYSEYLSLGITIVFVFVSIVASLISGILINGILKTSVEERIREFGIFRTLGAYKNYNLAIVLVQGFLLCNFGTIAGILGGIFATQYFLIPFAEDVILSSFGLTEGSVILSITISSLLIAYCMGIGVGLIVSISPAMKVRKLKLIESIHPYRHEDTLYHLQKKATVNYKLIIVGLILAANGLFVYIAIPRILISMDISLFAGILITILLIFLIGVTLAGIGLMPIILRLVIELFKPLAKQLHSVIKIFVFRYQRRNSSTVIIFAMSFSFVIFTSVLIQTLSAQTAVTTYLRYGSDLVMETNGWDYSVGSSSSSTGGGFGLFTSDLENNKLNIASLSVSQTSQYSIDPTRILTIDFEEKLMSIEGIEKVSSVLASPSQLTQIYSEAGKEFSAEIGDYAGSQTENINLYGIDDEYPSTVLYEYIKFTRGTMDEAFNELFENKTEKYCIISEALAITLNLELGDKIRITIQREAEIENYPFKIVGMASSMPGFSDRFAASQSAASGGGVLISQENYIEITNIPKLAFVDKIFIKLQETTVAITSNIETQIEDTYEKYYDFNLINLKERVKSQQQMYSVIETVFSLILSTTVVICLFGLLSSSYSAILERTKEIGIIRTLGLKGKEISKLFILESLIIMLSSGTVGVITGYFTGWLLSGSLNLISNSPVAVVFPWTNLIVIYILSTLFTIIGMHLLLRKTRKMKIVDIYRESM